MTHILLTLQKISWTSLAKGTSGNTWAYSNRKPLNTPDFFGDKNSGFKVSRQKKGVAFNASSTSDDNVMIWLSYWDDKNQKYVSLTDTEVQLYREEYGEQAYIDDNDKMITVAQYEELMSQGSDVTEDTTSEQPFAE